MFSLDFRYIIFAHNNAVDSYMGLKMKKETQVYFNHLKNSEFDHNSDFERDYFISDIISVSDERRETTKEVLLKGNLSVKYL